ncbi:hypothetical protein D3C87_1635880 [compost metagenome]
MKVLLPLIIRELPDPGAPLFWVANKPATRPANALVMLAVGTFLIASADTVLTAPVMVIFFWAPYPTTTTSFSALANGSSLISRKVLPPMGTSLDTNPTKLNTSVPSPPGTSKENSPSALVSVPVVVPLSRMLTPASGIPISSTTFPLTGAILIICDSFTSTFTGVGAAGMRERIMCFPLSSYRMFIG